MNKKRPEVIFLYPDFYTGQFHYHLGAGYIIAYLRQKGIYAEQFLNYTPLRMDELLKKNFEKKTINYRFYIL